MNGVLKGIYLFLLNIFQGKNLVADSLSREFSSKLEWSVDIDIFNHITNMTFVPDIDLFASRFNAKADCFVSWHPEPGAMAVDASSISWANLKCYAFPPFSLLTQVFFGKDTQRQGSSASRCSSVDNSELVSPAPSIGNRATNPTASEGQSSYIAAQPGTSSLEGQLTPSRMDVIRRSLADRGLSDDAITIISASWSSGTDKQYNSAWKKWCGWCEQRKIDLL